MKTRKENYISFVLCIISSVFVVLKMYTGSNIYLMVFLIAVCLGIVIDSMEHKIEYLIYFVPWVYSLKFQFTQFSLFVFMSALYILLCIIYLTLKNKGKIRIEPILSYIIFAIYVLIIPLIGESSITTTLGFLINYTAILFAVILVNNYKLFGRYTLMYALGLVSAGLVGLASFVVPSIHAYIIDMTNIQTVYAGNTLYSRFVGLDLDPNYFSIQVLIALSCLLVKIYYDKNDKKLSIMLLVILICLGIMTLSKMYIIMLVILFVIALVLFFRKNIKFAVKYLSLLLVFGGAAVYYTYDYIYEAFLTRFVGSGTSAYGITTGRSEIWGKFISEILNNFKILLVGAGYGTSYDFVAHNMYLTALYYMGIIGMVITFIYFVNLSKMLQLNSVSQDKIRLIDVNIIPLYILLIANMALDSFVMDFFPIQLFLALFAMNYRMNYQVVNGRE